MDEPDVQVDAAAATEWSGRDGDVTRTSADELERARPTVDAVELARIHAAVVGKVFRRDAVVRWGKYELRAVIGRGGMGTVHRAFDRELRREVAVKLLHLGADDEHARARSEREARTMAQLDHPNVVQVHEHGERPEFPGRLGIVMALAPGVSVDRWLRAASRPWRDVVRVIALAGRGLAAAHARGIVHRDVKPGNIIVETAPDGVLPASDGCVRVVDFGVARSGRAEVAGEPAPADAAARGHVTETGALVGTPPFMAPEQLAGEAATAASDQYALCATLHFALHGAVPFDGATLAERRAAILARRFAPIRTGADVPRWLRAVTARGLAANPTDRHPSMAALVAALERPRGWRRRAPGIVAVAAVAIGAAVTYAATRPPEAAVCDGGVDEVDRAWGAAARARVAAAFAGVDRPADVAQVAAALADLDRYRAAWSAGHRGACTAHQRGAESAMLLDRRMRCLRTRLEALRGAVDVLATPPATPGLAQVVTSGLPSIAICADRAAVESSEPLPGSARDQAWRVEALAALDRVRSQDRYGLSDPALARARTIAEEAAARGDRVVQAHASLAVGRILLQRDELDAARVPLALARDLAFAHGDRPAAIEAAARWLYVEGRLGADAVRLLGQADVYELMSRDLHDGFARPLLLNNIGVIHMARDAPGLAWDRFREALEALRDVAEPAPELIIIRRNLAMVTWWRPLREALAEEAWRRYQTALGPEHFSTVMARFVWSRYTDDVVAARGLADAACADADRLYPGAAIWRAECGVSRAFLASEMEDREAAVAAYRAVAELAASTTDRYVRNWGELAAGHVALAEGRLADADAHFAAVIAAFTGTTWFDGIRAAHGQLGAAEVALARSRPRDAAPLLERAIAAFTRAAAVNFEAEHRQRIALARRLLAEALRRLDGPGDRARAAALDDEVRRFYQRVSPHGYRTRLGGQRGR